MSKYKPLSERLSRHKADRWSASFAELEEVLGFPLPKAARDQNAWWRGGDAGASTSPVAPAAEVETEVAPDATSGSSMKRVLPTAVVGGAAALLAGGVAVLAGFLARRKGEPWR